MRMVQVDQVVLRLLNLHIFVAHEPIIIIDA